MKISYLIPTNQYDFFREIVPELQERGIEVEVNEISQSTELVLLAIAPATPEWHQVVDKADKPFVLWHWDLYSFVNYREDRWKWFLKRLSNAIDIWSCTYEIGRQLKEVYQLDSYTIPSWVNGTVFPHQPEGDYALYVAHSAAMGKRVEWAERACELLRLPIQVSLHEQYARPQYLKLVSGCRVYVMTAFEESNATIPSQEAGVMGKAIVLSDLPASREVFGRTAYYFPTCDFQGLLDQLQRAWDEGSLPGVRERILRNYDLPVVADRMAQRLREIYATRIQT